MTRHQLRLLLASLASIACFIASMFFMPWFRASFDFDLAELGAGADSTTLEIDLRAAKMCGAGACVAVSMGKLSGFYPTLAGIAFWCALPLILAVVFQCSARLLTGVGSDMVTRFGYLIAGIVLMTGFAAAFLFGPESKSVAGLAAFVVERTLAPVLFLLGSMIGMLALYTATENAEPAGEYKPVVTDRLPVTPLSVRPVTRTLEPATSANKSHTEPGTTKKSPSEPPGKKPTAPGVEPGTTKKSPSGPPLEAGKKATNPGEPAATKKSPSSPPVEPAATKKTPSNPPVEPARARTPSSIPLDTVDPRAKAPSAPPAVARTTSPSQLEARARATSSQPPTLAQGSGEINTRSRTSSSGPIDLAARLSATTGSIGVEVAIRPPLPVAEPVPPDEIAVAPESGLRIRKKTPSSSPPLARDGSIPIPTVPAHAAQPEPGVAFRPASQEIPKATHAPASSHVQTSHVQTSTPSNLLVPPLLRGKIRYTTTIAELTGAGIKAWREDGSTKIVAWEEIRGIVARRLPPEQPYESATFVDIVSSAGSTLRVLPWTQIRGHVFVASPVERARAFVNIAAAQALDAKLDAATKLFAETTGHAAQLPTTATLRTHDDRLA
jgi:hypothetical protein